jgi:hypothetical protein
MKRGLAQGELHAGAEARRRERDVAVRIVGPELEPLGAARDRGAQRIPSLGQRLVGPRRAGRADRTPGQRLGLRDARASRQPGLFRGRNADRQPVQELAAKRVQRGPEAELRTLAEDLVARPFGKEEAALDIARLDPELGPTALGGTRRRGAAG